MRLSGVLHGIAVTSVALAMIVASAPAAAKPDEASARALVLFERGKLAYQEGRFDESILLLKEAYAIKAEPVLLYNLGRAHEANGQLSEAVDAYERYLASATAPPDRPEVEAKIADLEAKIAQVARDAETAAAAERQAREDREREAREQRAEREAAASPNLVPWIVAGSGAVIVGVGATFGVLALGKNSDASEARSQKDAVDQQDSAESLALVSTISLIVGGAVLAGGATWGIIDLTGSAEESGRLEIQVHGTGASFRGDF